MLLNCWENSWKGRGGLSFETFREKGGGAYVCIDADCEVKSTERTEDGSILGDTVSTFIKCRDCIEETLAPQGADWVHVGSFKMAFSITSSTSAGNLLQMGRGGSASKFGTLTPRPMAELSPLIFVRIMFFMHSGLPRRKLSWHQT